ncbi:MAG: DUF4837 family protein [Mangrovibacterium sp.]
MKQLFSVSLIFLLVFSLISCRDGGVVMRNITGKPGELVVVVPRESWDGKVGEAMKKVLLQPQVGLPQDEPLFTTVDIPPAAFKDIFKTSRNILNVLISPTLDSSRVELKDDVWAAPQAVINIHARSTDDFVSMFEENSDRILAFLLKAERDRLQTNYVRYGDKTLRNMIKEKFNIELHVGPGFTLASEGEHFAWMRYDTPEITQGIAVYTFPYQSDSTFTADYLVHKRDSVFKKYIEGPLPGSFMTTEHRIPPYIQLFRFKNNYAAEMRGLWRVENDFMGGPYLNLAVLDLSGSRVIVLDGFVYAPRFEKRNYLRQVEAMVYSLSLPYQDKNDKVNSQLLMGN